MTDELLRRFRELNPVPDPDRFVDLGAPDWPADPVLRAVLAEVSDNHYRPGTARLGLERDVAPKERPMPTLTPPRNEVARPEPPSRRRWLSNAAAVAAVVLAVGLIARFGPLDGDVLSPAATEPGFDVEIDADLVSELHAQQATNDRALAMAQAYIDARNNYDADRARELVADNFRTSEVPDAYTLETMELAFEVHEAYGFQYTDGDCEIGHPNAGQRLARMRVTCEYLWTTELQRITGYPPVPVGFLFRIQDGRIATIHHDWNSGEFVPEVYDPWLDFLGENHPEFREIDLATHGLEPEGTRTFIEQAPEYFALYEQWVQEQAG